MEMVDGGVFDEVPDIQVGSLEDMQVPDVLAADSLCPDGTKFQISGLQDVRNIIKDTPVHHLQVGSLEDMQVPDALAADSSCPGGAKFQISGLQDVRNLIKDTPVHHLQVGSLEVVGS